LSHLVRLTDSAGSCIRNPSRSASPVDQSRPARRDSEVKPLTLLPLSSFQRTDAPVFGGEQRVYLHTSKTVKPPRRIRYNRRPLPLIPRRAIAPAVGQGTCPAFAGQLQAPDRNPRGLGILPTPVPSCQHPAALSHSQGGLSRPGRRTLPAPAAPVKRFLPIPLSGPRSTVGQIPPNIPHFSHLGGRRQAPFC